MILMRHGQTVFNVVYGETCVDPGIEDPHLTDTGRDQARDAADRLRGAGVTRLIASPYTRALQTADILAGLLDVPVSIEPLARERAAFACDVGSTRSELTRRWGHLELGHLDEIWWTPLEERESDFARRCAAFRRAMGMQADWSTVAVITHWGVIRELTGRIVRNCEFVRFDPTAAASRSGEVLVRDNDP